MALFSAITCSLARQTPRQVDQLIARGLVCALAAWMSLCCCEKRILAHCFDAPTDPPASCCGSGCCGVDADAPQAPARPGPVSCCADGCCTKAAFALDWFAPSVDTIGASLPAAVVAIDPQLAAGRVLMHEDLAVGEPPPRLALLISRRLRI